MARYVIPRWGTSSSSRVGVSKAVAFRVISRTVCSPHPTLNLRRPKPFQSPLLDLEQSSAGYHIYSVTSRFLLSIEDILLRTLLPVILLSCSRNENVIYGHVNCSCLLSYMGFSKNPLLDPKNSRWRTSAILKIAESPASDFDEIWYTTADLELSDNHATKYKNFQKFKMVDGRHFKDRYLDITQRPTIRFQWHLFT